MGPEWHYKPVIILGCGNILFGDDGFGPAVAQSLRRDFIVPDEVCIVDAGTSVRQILFDIILLDKKPSKIVILDAMDCGREPGELFALDIDCIPKNKLDSFSVHQVPTSNLLRELRDFCNIEVIVIVCQVSSTPNMVSPGLSKQIEEAVKYAAETIAREHFK
jgi:coenzyme F420 hydrogenase subunit delta